MIFAIFIFVVLILTIYNVDFYDKIDFDKSIKKANEVNRKKYLTECELFNEVIDRSIKDSERQCYYNCGENDSVRVDTSIEYICQPFILEER
ncbi:MAG: hypothetical protein CMP43_01865 [Rickettsiales bacterium]|nr:hypothetical protein [Rickettsiales bacterium]